MRCEDVQPRLSDILDQRLTAEGRQEIESHMQGCGACHAVFLRLRAVSALVLVQKSSLPAQATDAYFDDAVSRLEKKLATEFPDLQGAAPFPEGDLFASDLDSFARLGSSEATGISIPTAFVAARRESSYLFKLDDLSRLGSAAKPKSKPTPSEGSGLLSRPALHNILRDMGQNNASARPGTDTSVRPGIVIGSSFPADEPKRRWPLILAIAGSALALAAVVLLFVSGALSSQQPGTQQLNPHTNPELAVNTATPPATPAANPAVNPTPTPDPAVTATPNTPPTVATPAVDPKKDPKKDPKVVDPKAATATPKETTKTETPAVTPTPTPDKTAVAPANSGKNKDELDDLLGGKKDTGTATASGPETLSSSQISAVMSKANTSSCAAIGTGKVPMKVTISSSGSVTSATGDGTPLGNCVSGIVRRLKFPSISSPSQTFPYPVYVK
jgi:outer membrane biosynthesis protein TonB